MRSSKLDDLHRLNSLSKISVQDMDAQAGLLSEPRERRRTWVVEQRKDRFADVRVQIVRGLQVVENELSRS